MARATTATTPPEKITRDDLQQKFQTLQAGWRDKIEEKKKTLASAVVIGGVVVSLVVYLLGRRSGKRKATVVEIRRF